MSKNLHENRVEFPKERTAFILDHQHGHRDVTCKVAIILLVIIGANLQYPPLPPFLLLPLWQDQAFHQRVALLG